MWLEVLLNILCVKWGWIACQKCKTWYYEVCVGGCRQKAVHMCKCLHLCSLNLSEQNGQTAERNRPTIFYTSVYCITRSDI
jgi:hypothetical protein